MERSRPPFTGGLIGVVHLAPLPGDPAHTRGGFGAVEARALSDAEALVAGGVDALLVENFGSAPFCKGTGAERIPPHQTAALTLVARACRARFEVPVGVNCLRNDALSALGIAAMADLSFVRVNVHTGAYVTDQGLIEGEAARSLRYRAALDAGSLDAGSIAIVADVLVKHAAPLAPLEPEAAVRDALDRGLADAVVVTGEATGAPVAEGWLRRAADAAADRPLFIGSGLTPGDAERLAPLAHGAIVGTWVKEGGDVRGPVDVDRVKRMAAAVAGRFRPYPEPAEGE